MKILIVEDDSNLRDGLVRSLRKERWQVDAVAGAADALESVADADVLVTDIRMPGMDGLELLKTVRAEQPQLEVIVMTAFGTIPSAIEAMRWGARAYLTKPFDTEELVLHLREVQKLLDLKVVAGKAGRGRLVGSSTAMQRVYREIDVSSASLAPVLITGETGTGKDLTANAIHAISSRKDGPFVAVNLGALPRDLVEGELFGHEKGAFTGAHAKRQGRFTVADGGTIFLDEIDSLPMDLQPKLLRAIENKEVWPLGAEKRIQVDVRIVAATNAALEDRIADGAFREDLYYRLNVLRIEMPSLREHAEDIPQITHKLLEELAAEQGVGSLDITPTALSHLIALPWQGNARELSNMLQRALARALAQTDERGAMTLDADAFEGSTPSVPSDLPFREGKSRAADEWAKQAIRAALSDSDGNVSEAARQLQMSRTALIRLLNKYDIQR